MLRLPGFQKLKISVALACLYPVGVGYEINTFSDVI